jgi:hypothetical protein
MDEVAVIDQKGMVFYGPVGGSGFSRVKAKERMVYVRLSKLNFLKNTSRLLQPILRRICYWLQKRKSIKLTFEKIHVNGIRYLDLTWTIGTL